MLRFLIGLCALLAVSLPAHSDTFTFRVKSLHPNLVELKLFGVDRNVVWPRGGKIYALDDDNTHAMTLSCRAGEKICFGAWVAGSGRPQWGKGRDGRAGCDRCCHLCTHNAKS